MIIMRHTLVFTLFAAQSADQLDSTKAFFDKLMENLVGGIVKRALKGPHFMEGDLRATTLGRPGHLQIKNSRICGSGNLRLTPQGNQFLHPQHAVWQTHCHFEKGLSIRSLAVAESEMRLPTLSLPERYDPQAAAHHFAKKPGRVLSRALEIAGESAGFAAAIAADNARGQDSATDPAPARARELRSLLERLGPTFVKFGQAASIREDLVPKAYARELRNLQDAVPPFSSDRARAIIDFELRAEGGVEGIFSELSNEPIASASLGQVYRGVLHTGQKVAVKVQRPEVMESIQLDLYLLRRVAPGVKKRAKLNTDLPGLVDEWGYGFLNELDYRSEARKAREFNMAMQELGVDTVIAPEPFENLTTRRVLVSQWIDGERLEESSADDVAKLCGVALTAYLTMLLDTGCLHADPHPGNLMRTTDGRLCILDWGLTTTITTEQQYAIVDYIAHLVAEDYDRVPEDLVALGFVPEDKVKAMADAGVAKTVGLVFRQLAKGGGAKKVIGRTNIQDIGVQVGEIRAKYGNILQTPVYFAYILRSFSILEGIGLQSDPDYAIVRGCYPYIAKRLFRVSDERTQAALKAIIYKKGPGGHEQLNPKMLLKLAQAYNTYTDQRLTRLGQVREPDKPSADNQVLREALNLLLNREGNFLQELVLKEGAKAVDVAGRQALLEAGDFMFGIAGSRGIEPLAFCYKQLAILTPTIKDNIDLALAPASDDEAVLSSLNVSRHLLQPEIQKLITNSQIRGSSDVRDSFARIAPVAQELAPELLPGALVTAMRFNLHVFDRVCNRIFSAADQRDSIRR